VSGIYSSTFNAGRWTMTIDNRVETVRAGVWTLDSEWRGTDSNGHEHYYADGGYPTLDYIIDESHWCNGEEGFAHHDPHEHVDRSHYECLVCREVVEPAQLPPDTPIRIPQSRSVTLEGDVSPHHRIRMWLTDDEYQLLANEPTDAVAEAILQNAPQDRIIEQRWQP